MHLAELALKKFDQLKWRSIGWKSMPAKQFPLPAGIAVDVFL